MTINTKRKFFWSKIQKYVLLLILILQLLACARKEPLKIDAFKTTSGWGYSISTKKKIIIKQAIIPVINDIKSFSTQEDALKVGHLVVTKLNRKLSPTVTKNDLILLKIKL